MAVHQALQSGGAHPFNVGQLADIKNGHGLIGRKRRHIKIIGGEWVKSTTKKTACAV
jgi:hypothetical protein